MSKGKTEIVRLLQETIIEVSPETFTVISLNHDKWLKLLENPELSPRMTAPFLIFKDKWEVTLVFDETDFAKIKDSIAGGNVETNFRLLSFDVKLDFDVVGFMAQISKIFAEAGISILPFSSFSRDHVLVRQENLADALKALGPHIHSVC